jgi:hypothetical protein
MYGESPAKHTYYRTSNQGGKLVKSEQPHAPHGKNRGEPISETNPVVIDKVKTKKPIKIKKKGSQYGTIK